MTTVKSPQIFFLLTTIFIYFPADSNTSAIRRYCANMPYPNQCNYYLPATFHFRPNQKPNFHKLSIQAAMKRAIRAQLQIKRAQPRFNQRCEKAAWAECFKLHEFSIVDLNRTLTGLYGPKRPACTGLDGRTWLSAALTNLDTCRVSSVELNVPPSIAHLLSPPNVSELISNSLAGTANISGMNFKSEEDGVELSRRNGFRRRFSAKAKIVVAHDGSGEFRTVQSAIDAATRRGGGESGRMFVIRVREGIYRENIEVGRDLNYVMLVGDGMRKTVITGSRNAKDGLSTYNTATVGIDGMGFVARGISFENTAGPENAQAVALRSSSDLSIFYRCGFLGFQDTLFVHSQRQFYMECYIYGTVDMIFGNAAAVFQSCIIFARTPIPGQSNIVTAQGRDDPNQNSGISIHNSQIRSAPDSKPRHFEYKTYLGRPWQRYSRVAVMKSYIGGLVDPEGWSDWDHTDFAKDSLYFGEYRNFGPSSSTSLRVKWKGFHVIRDRSEAAMFTVEGFIAGGSWLTAARVPFTSGL